MKKNNSINIIIPTVFLRKHILFIHSFGVLVLAQSRFLTKNIGYGIYNFLDLRNFMGASTFQLILILIVVLLLFVKARPVKYIENIKLRNYLLIVFFLSILSTILFATHFTAGFRTIISYIGPMLYFVVFASFYWNKSDIKYYINVLGVLFFLNILIGFIQWIFNGYSIDNLQGVLDDAHQFSLMMYFGALYFITKWYVYKKKWYLFVSVLPIVLALVASDDKATIFFLLVLFILYIINYKISIKLISFVLIIALLIVSTSHIVTKEFTTLKDSSLIGGLLRLKTVNKTADIEDVLRMTAQYNAYKMIPEIYAENPYSIILGLGPTQYGSEESDLNAKYGFLAFPQNPGALLGTHTFSRGTSFILVIIIEFGLISTLLYFIFIRKLLSFTFSYRLEKRDLFFKHLLLWMLGYLLLILMLSVISTREGLAGSTNTIPYFALLGIIYSCINYKYIRK